MSTSAAATQINPQQGCRLASLPPEIRIRIYEYVMRVRNTKYGSARLSSTRHTPLTFNYAPRPPSKQPTHSALRLLETCKLFHMEAEQIFYKVNSIEISHHIALFLPNEDPAFSHWAWAEALTMLRWMAVKRFTITVDSFDSALPFLFFARVIPQLRKRKLVVNRVDATRMAFYNPSRDTGLTHKEVNAIDWFLCEVGQIRVGKDIRITICPLPRLRHDPTPMMRKVARMIRATGQNLPNPVKDAVRR